MQRLLKAASKKKLSHTSSLKFSSLTNYLPTLESTLSLFTIHKKIPENFVEKYMEDDFLGPRSSGKFPEATEHLKRKSCFSDGIFQTEAGSGFFSHLC